LTAKRNHFDSQIMLSPVHVYSSNAEILKARDF
jgi:hypothetical protein